RDRLVEGTSHPHRLGLTERSDQPRELVPPARDEATVPPGRAGAADVLLDEDHPRRRLELPNPERGPEARVAAAEDRDVRLRAATERQRGAVRAERGGFGGKCFAE